jgi:hypothetical protein
MAFVVVQVGGIHEHGDWWANGGSQEKIPRPLLKLGARNKKEEKVGVVGCWPRNKQMMVCHLVKTRKLMN